MTQKGGARDRSPSPLYVYVIKKYTYIYLMILMFLPKTKNLPTLQFVLSRLSFYQAHQKQFFIDMVDVPC